MNRTTTLAAVTIAAALALAGCSSDTPTATASTVADDAANLACTHFRNIMSDISKGLLTDAEIRTKIQQVYDTAQVSTKPGIAPDAQAMLAAATANDGTAFTNAAAAFSDACTKLGD